MDIDKIEDGIKYRELFNVLPIMKYFHDEWKQNDDCFGFSFQKDYLSIYGVRSNLRYNEHIWILNSSFIEENKQYKLFKQSFENELSVNGNFGNYLLCGSIVYDNIKYLVMFGMQLSTILLIPETSIVYAFSEVFIKQFSMNIMDNEFYKEKFLESVDFVNTIKEIHNHKAKAINKSDTLPNIKIFEDKVFVTNQVASAYINVICELSKLI